MRSRPEPPGGWMPAAACALLHAHASFAAPGARKLLQVTEVRNTSSMSQLQTADSAPSEQVSPPAESDSDSDTLLVGGLIGGILAAVAVLLAIVLLYLWRRGRRRQKKQREQSIEMPTLAFTSATQEDEQPEAEASPADATAYVTVVSLPSLGKEVSRSRKADDDRQAAVVKYPSRASRGSGRMSLSLVSAIAPLSGDAGTSESSPEEERDLRSAQQRSHFGSKTAPVAAVSHIEQQMRNFSDEFDVDHAGDSSMEDVSSSVVGMTELRSQSRSYEAGTPRADQPKVPKSASRSVSRSVSRSMSRSEVKGKIERLKPTGSTSTIATGHLGPSLDMRSKSGCSMESLENALDHMHELGDKLLDRWEICSGMRCRVRDQELLQYAVDHRTGAEHFIRFYLQQDVFERRAELFTQPQLREVMAAVVHVERNEGAAVQGPGGYVFPSFVVSERGQTLHDYVLRKHPSFTDSVQVLIQVVEQVSIMHAARFVHRDLTSMSILWRPSLDEWVLTGFGNTARSGEESTIACSLPYAAPEVVRSFEAGLACVPTSAAIDIFACGVIMYEMLTQSRLFTRDMPREDICAELAGRMPLPWESGATRCFRADELRSLRQLVLECLSRDASRRPSAREIVSRLRRSL